MLVVDKPAGLVVHPGAGNTVGHARHGLVARFPEIADVGDPARPGIVHRLDKGTSGLLVVARSPAAYESLVDAALSLARSSGGTSRSVWGRPEPATGVIDAPVGRSSRDPHTDDGAAHGVERRARTTGCRRCTGSPRS